MHYHNGMPAGENTLNAHCARLILRQLADQNLKYDIDEFVKAYIAFMTSDVP